MKILNDYYINLPSPYGRPTLCAVLTEDDIGQRAVYISIAPDGTAEDEVLRYRFNEWTASAGAKQSYKQALYYFPMLREATYRA